MTKRRLKKGELKTIIRSHPGVIRHLREPVTCEGFVTTGFSFKKRREGRLPTCKKPGYWVFRPLDRRIFSDEKPQRQEPITLCWTHLIYRGVFGGMEEEARTWRWLDKLGYRTPKHD